MFAARYVPELRKRRYSESDEESLLEQESSLETSPNFEEKQAVSMDLETTSVETPKEEPSGSESLSEDEAPGPGEESSKHKSVLKRLRRSAKRAELRPESSSDESSDDSSEELEEHDLAPMPQPELPKDKKLKGALISQNLDWIAEPQVYPSSLRKDFKELLKAHNAKQQQQVLANLASNNFESAFAVQSVVFDHFSTKSALNPDSSKGDLLVNAATGSGKTLAYLLPIILALRGRVVPKLACVILVPTRPLISQVLQTANMLSKNTNLRISASNVNLAVLKELERFEAFKPDILISTPGRLVDYLSHGANVLSMKYLRFLVIDEVDKLLNQSFQNWISVMNTKISHDKRTLENVFCVPVQKLLFSATLHNDVEKLSLLNFYRPKLLVIDDDTGEEKASLFKIPPNLEEFEVFVKADFTPFKPLVLFKLLLDENVYDKQVLIFTKSNESTLRLSKLLLLILAKYQQFYQDDKDLKVQYLNSMINANNKKKLLNKFKDGKVKILVVTDLVSRGLDLPNVDQVINYDMPQSAIDYIHRVGRCGRAYNHGEAISILCGNGERKKFNRLTGEVKRSQGIKPLAIDTEFSDLEKGFYEAALEGLQEAVKGQ